MLYLNTRLRNEALQQANSDNNKGKWDCLALILRHGREVAPAERAGGLGLVD